MSDLVEEITRANEKDIDKLIKAILLRYEVLYPDWEISTITLQKGSDRNEQIDRTITWLQSMKTSS